MLLCNELSKLNFQRHEIFDCLKELLKTESMKCLLFSDIEIFWLEAGKSY